jgi:signal transduction histidine kinase/CheY-like chemotaxis protein/HPt (histidine-containing phosphotransfer) domain-containing protein
LVLVAAAPAPAESKTLTEIRSDVCNATLLWLSAAAVPALFLSLLRIMTFGWLPVMGLHIAVVAALVAVTAARRRAPYYLRTITVVAVCFLAGVGGHLTFGSPNALVFFISASIMAAVFFGERVGIAVIGLSAVTLMGIYFGISTELLPALHAAPNPMRYGTWLANTGVAVVSAIGPLIAVSRYRQYLDLERRRAETANEAKSDFLAMMSHELRTPLTAILGIADLLMIDPLPPEQRGRVERIVNAGHLLLGLLNDVLDFSKIEAHRLQIERIPFSPRELIGELYEFYLPLAMQKGLELRVETAADLNEALVGDPARLTQVLHNLLNNAIKFTEHGRVVIQVSQADSPLGVTSLRVDVADTGIGLSPGQQANLFEPFTQANSGVSRRYGGTGLGLAISRRLVELMGGDIGIASAEGAGATFSFTVPVGLDRSAKVAGPADIFTPARKGAAALRLLVVEDNEATRYLLTTMLTRWGYRVESAEHGALALAAVQARSFDAVLMDMQMQVMDGPTATRAIRALPGDVAKIPIIALTADIASGHRATYMEAGIDAIMGKPVDWAELAARLERIAGKGALLPAEVSALRDVAPDEAILNEASLAEMADAFGTETLDRLLVTFRENMAEYKVKLFAALAAGDMVQVRRTGHALKGLCLQFGAMRVATLAKTLETEADTLDKMRPVIAAIAHEILAADQAAVARASGTPTPHPLPSPL